MNIMDDPRKWKAIYRLLDKVNTLVYDCGKLCGQACCTCYHDSEEMGIYLFPGEHRFLGLDETENPVDGSSGLQEVPAGQELPVQLVHPGNWLEWEIQDPQEAGFPDSWTEPVYFVKCKTPPDCPRHLRPLQCRTFPLKPVIGEQGVLELIWNDDDLPYCCPVIENNLPIHDDFYKATYTVWTHLLQDRRIMDLILSWS